MKCQKCGKDLQDLEASDVTASVNLIFKNNEYIPRYTIWDYVIICPHCEEPLEDLPISKNLVVLHADNVHKSVLVDLQNVPFDVKGIEQQEELEKRFRNMGISDHPRKRKKKE